MGYRHVSVMPTEVMRFLDPQPGDICVDATVGGAGHAAALCRAIHPDGLFIGVDRDRAAIDHASRTLARYGEMVRLFRANFVDLPRILAGLGVDGVDAMVVDLGLSFHQIRQSGRGFSFQADEPLDMRMNAASDLTAADLVNRLSERELADVFRKYGEERWARRIARAIGVVRRKTPVETSRQLADIVAAAVPKSRQPARIHPATRVFMALRIAVNRELECLAEFLAFFPEILKSGGRLCMIAFHSLEDRMVKRRFAELAKGCVCPPGFPVCACGRKPVVRVLNKKAVKASQAEISANPLARSARLRAVARL